MNKILWVLLAVLSIAVAIFCIVMTVMAVQFMEWGRVLFYGLITLIYVEGLLLAIMNLKKKS